MSSNANAERRPRTPPRRVVPKPAAVATALLLLVPAGLAPAQSGAAQPAAPPPPPATAPARPSPELLALWAELDAARTDALRLARNVESDTLPQARENHRRLLELTRRFNQLVAPVADASPLRYGQPQPRGGIGKGIWLYKAARAIERYNLDHAHENTPDEFEVLRLVNDYREALGLLPLELDPRLIDAARQHSRWMVESGNFSHESDLPGRKTHGQRMDRAGYTWRSAGENIAFGTGELNTPQAIFNGWFDSPGHHRTMLGDYVHLGVGRFETHWTQNFGLGPPARAVTYRPRPAGPAAAPVPPGSSADPAQPRP